MGKGQMKDRIYLNEECYQCNGVGTVSRLIPDVVKREKEITCDACGGLGYHRTDKFFLVEDIKCVVKGIRLDTKV